MVIHDDYFHQRAAILRKDARIYALTTKYFSHADDFASFCVAQLYSSKTGQLIALWKLFAEYKRQEFGDTRTSDGFAKAYANHHKGSRSLRQSQIDDKYKRIFELVEDLNLTGENRTLVLLHVLWGFTIKELSLITGLPESTVFGAVKRATLNVSLSRG